jgi:hypothetical protein
MFGSGVLDVAIGVAFLYLLLSLLCSAITEGIARIFALRSGNLKAGVQNLLNNQTVPVDGKQKDLAQAIYEHPLIKGLYRQGWFDRRIGREGKPSYIPSRTFALALFNVLGGTGKTLDELKNQVAGIQSDWIKRSLLPLVSDAKNLAAARANVEGWFDDAMERVSGWYKRKAQVIILLVALVVSVALNADTLEVTTTLWNDTAIRESVVAAAQQASQQPLSDDINVLKKQLTELPLPLGWEAIPDSASEWLAKIVGLLVTTLALSFGAPFWFDALNKLIRVRDSGASPDTTGTSSGRSAEEGAGG